MSTRVLFFPLFLLLLLFEFNDNVKLMRYDLYQIISCVHATTSKERSVCFFFSLLYIHLLVACDALPAISSISKIQYNFTPFFFFSIVNNNNMGT